MILTYDITPNRPHIKSHFNNIYISGTIGSPVATDEILSRFNLLQRQLEVMGFNVYNPIRGKGTGDKLYCSNAVVHRDEIDIDRSDLLIATFPYDTISIGTPMEIYRAREICKIPVLVISPIEKIRNHYWIQNKATKIFSSTDEAIEHIKVWYL